MRKYPLPISISMIIQAALPQPAVMRAPMLTIMLEGLVQWGLKATKCRVMVMLPASTQAQYTQAATNPTCAPPTVRAIETCAIGTQY